MNKINFENGTLVEPAKVTIDGVTYNVVPEEWDTNTPLSAEVLNQLESNIEESAVIISKTQPTTREKVWIKKGKNILNKDTMIAGYRFGSDGLLFSDSSYSASDFIKVLPNTTYTCNWTLEIRECVCYYDKNGEFISRNVSDATFTTPANCKYIRTSRLTTQKDTAQVELGTTSTTYESFIEEEILVKNDNDVYEEFINISDVVRKIGGIEVRNDGTIYNSKTNKKLAEESIQEGTLVDTSNYFSSIDIHRVIKQGKVAQIVFRGQLSRNITPSDKILKSSYTPFYGSNGAGAVYLGGRYSTDNLAWFYMDASGYIQGITATSGKYIHINYTYIMN